MYRRVVWTLPLCFAAVLVSACGGEQAASSDPDSCPVSKPYGVPEGQLSDAQLKACQERFKTPDVTSQAWRNGDGSDNCSPKLVYYEHFACGETFSQTCEAAVRDGHYKDIDYCIYPHQHRWRTVEVTKDPRLTIRIGPTWGAGKGNVGPWDEADMFSDIAFTKVPRIVYDPRSDKGTFAPDFVAWLLQHEYLETEPPVQVRFGELVGTQVEFRVIRDDPTAMDAGFCGTTNSRGPCLPLTADPSDEGYVSLYVIGGEQNRFVVLHGRAEGVLIVVTRGSPGFYERADSVLRSLKLGN